MAGCEFCHKFIFFYDKVKYNYNIHYNSSIDNNY